MENLDTLTDLDALNLNQNVVKSIAGLGQLRRLNTLLLQGNKLSSLESLRGLAECPSIGVLDLSKNKLEDEGVLALLASALPGLKVLYLKDNPLVETLPNYRRRVVSSLPNLTYLDERPVFPEERRTADAWARGGKAEEQLERQKIEEEKQQKHTRNYQAFEKMLQDARIQQGAGPGAIQGGRIVEEKEEGAAAADSEDDAVEEQEEQESNNKEEKTSEPPALEDAEDSDAILQEHVVRPTAKITFTHSAAATPAAAAAATPSAAAAASAQPLLSLTPATAAAAAIKPTVAGAKKKMLIEMVDDEEEEKVLESSAATATTQLPDRGLIQQLD